MVFRTVFPGARGYLSVISRVTLELSAVRDFQRLFDPTGLGSSGRAYICSRTGRVIGAAKPHHQAIFDAPYGKMRTRYAWELNEPWAYYLEASFFETGYRRSVLNGQYQLVIEPLTGHGMDEFAVLLAGETDPFKDTLLLWLGKIAYVLLCVPIIGSCCISGAFAGYQKYQVYKNQIRIYDFNHTTSSFGSTSSLNSNDHLADFRSKLAID